MLEIKDLHVEVDGKEIVKGVSLKVGDGEFHVIMGPNGSGKTTLAKTVMGHPKMKVTKGEITFNGESIKGLGPDGRAKLGIFMQFQNPVQVEGVGFVNFVRSAREAAKGPTDMKGFMEDMRRYSTQLNIKNGIIGRSLNQGFSGGEMKKAEILQMAMMKPKLALLDEPDSGLDVDAIKLVAQNINEIAKENGTSLVVITHYSRILEYMSPQFVHVMADGRIVAEGGTDLIKKLEEKGYEPFIGK